MVERDLAKVEVAGSSPVIRSICGGLAQLGEHLPYKQRVTGSSPVVPTIGPVVQLVRTLACHARGREFEPHPGRQCGFSSSGRAPPCQGGGSEFEPRHPLQSNKIGTHLRSCFHKMVPWPSGKATDFDSVMRGFKSRYPNQNLRYEYIGGFLLQLFAECGII